MSDLTKQVTGLINEELSRVTRTDLDAVRSLEKTAGAPGPLIFGGLGALTAALGGVWAGSQYSNATMRKELEELKKQQLQKNLLSAGLGAAAAINLRKPVQGLLAPDPEDQASLDSEEFDDIWKQRSRRRHV
jgi:hypothetical protein